jgi:hypothetical protein
MDVITIEGSYRTVNNVRLMSLFDSYSNIANITLYRISLTLGDFD